MDRLGTDRLGVVRFVSASLLASLVVAFGGSAGAQQNTRLFDERGNRGYAFEGPYAQFGIAVGRIDFDGNVDSDASGGFTMTGGYRFLPWLSAEANFTYLGGGDVEVRNRNVGDGEFFAFTFGPKIYPLGALTTDAIPDIIQPYGLIQIGGGQFEIDDTSYEEDSFIARFIIGFDVWMTDHVGFFVEGGGDAASEDDVDGVGIFTVGGQYRF
ncbi:MAG: porin family protein [Spirochaetaceae bacterium]|nr:porin family protein [Myxococcales bacterium]MCB9724669.1 porin family protein [Spirochaetaceae bacterium]HPG25505.1 outer membrane beta-barrel protein [Myxococcota bacterium]